MFGLFDNKKIVEETGAGGGFSLRHPPVPHLDFSAFPHGIDNVHIDVALSAEFVRLSKKLVQDTLLEYGTGSKRMGETPSPTLNENLGKLAGFYADILETAIHRAKSERRVDKIQLLQVACAKLLLATVREQSETLVNELRTQALQAPHGGARTPELHERAARMARQQPSLMPLAAQLLFAQLQKIENSRLGQLRESLLGARWPVPEAVLFNPLLINGDKAEQDLQMQHYVLLHQNAQHPYGFASLDNLTDTLLELALQETGVAPAADVLYEGAVELRFSWKDDPACIDWLFNHETTARDLSWAHESEDKLRLGRHLKLQETALKTLAKYLRRSEALLYISAAYYTPGIYPHFAYALKPYSVFRVLCGEMELETAYQKIAVQQKVRARRARDDFEPATTLARIKKEVKQAASGGSAELGVRFLRDFVRYRRDLKYRSLLLSAMRQVHLLHDDKKIRLSQTNAVLQAFLRKEEYTQEDSVIRSHVILKADIRGSTTVVDELRRRGLNPATHFSLNFFDPIRKLLKIYGAEKIFIEGDAIILGLFEYMEDPGNWLAAARACGLAQSMLEVVESQNQFCRQHGLPILEMGVGICHEDCAPTFLYDGDQRVTISPAIGLADRLSSCSWALRKKFGEAGLLSRVLVFEQPDNAFKGEKGVTTLRYNLNGIELDALSFAKLCGEVNLQPFTASLPREPEEQRFYAGRYPDTLGEFHELLVREGAVRQWDSSADHYPDTGGVYYEVMSPRLLQVHK